MTSTPFDEMFTHPYTPFLLTKVGENVRLYLSQWGSVSAYITHVSTSPTLETGWAGELAKAF